MEDSLLSPASHPSFAGQPDASTDKDQIPTTHARGTYINSPVTNKHGNKTVMRPSAETRENTVSPGADMFDYIPRAESMTNPSSIEVQSERTTPEKPPPGKEPSFHPPEPRPEKLEPVQIPSDQDRIAGRCTNKSIIEATPPTPSVEPLPRISYTSEQQQEKYEAASTLIMFSRCLWAESIIYAGVHEVNSNLEDPNLKAIMDLEGPELAVMQPEARKKIHELMFEKNTREIAGMRFVTVDFLERREMSLVAVKPEADDLDDEEGASPAPSTSVAAAKRDGDKYRNLRKRPQRSTRLSSRFNTPARTF